MPERKLSVRIRLSGTGLRLFEGSPTVSSVKRNSFVLGRSLGFRQNANGTLNSTQRVAAPHGTEGGAMVVVVFLVLFWSCLDGGVPVVQCCFGVGVFWWSLVLCVQFSNFPIFLWRGNPSRPDVWPALPAKLP